MARRKSRLKAFLVFGISVLLSVVFFLFDMNRKEDIAVWLFYLIPLLITSYVAPRWMSLLLLSLCTVLIGLGVTAHPTIGWAGTELINRLIAVIVLWLTIVILMERKTAEDALRESKDRYRDLVELSPETIYIQQGGKFVFVNSVGVSLFGARTEKDLLGKSVLDFIHPECRETAASRASMEATATEEIPAVEEKYVRFDGSPVEMEVSAVPVDYHGRPALQVFARNITGRKQLEEQLRQSQKIEAVGRLAGGIAHDFNNLMTVITGYVGLTKKRLGDPDLVARGLDEIAKAGGRATRLTQQLIAFSRKQILQPQILDLNHIVSGMEKMLRRLIGEDIELTTTLGKGLGKVKADPGQIEQVIVNLALNARDAMPKGGRLTIETGNIEIGPADLRGGGTVQPGPWIKMVFRDAGVGMDQETKAHIFEPYFTTKEVGKGSGLGLATVYGIIRQSGGDIWVESEQGKGSTFMILLPRTGEAAADVEPYDLILELPPGLETILLVEDEEPVRTLVRETLEDAGYRVLEASDGEDALTLISGNNDPIHLLLTDVVMPKMGGRALAAQIASLHPETKVLFMTGYVDTDIDRQFNPLGRRPMIFKPFTPHELARKVRDILDA